MTKTFDARTDKQAEWETKYFFHKICLNKIKQSLIFFNIKICIFFKQNIQFLKVNMNKKNLSIYVTPKCSSQAIPITKYNTLFGDSCIFFGLYIKICIFYYYLEYEMHDANVQHSNTGLIYNTLPNI